MQIDLHGYHPTTLGGDLLEKIVEQAWETGDKELVLIHGHGRDRGNPAPFANTNTGWLGLTVRGVLRREKNLRKWAYAKIDVTAPSYTVVRLKPNPNPTREKIDSEIFPKRDFGPHGTRWKNF